MKIEVEIPDRPGNLPIYVFQNLEPVARKFAGQPWEVKVAACNDCGICCRRYHDRKGRLPTTPEGGCANLKARGDGTYRCGIPVPLECLISNCEGVIPECSVRWSSV